MKFSTLSLMAALWAACLFTGPMGALAQDEAPKPPDNVAVVNGVAITRNAFESEFKAATERMAATGQQLSGVQSMMMRKQIVESLINEELLVQECQKKDIQVTDDQVNTEIDGIKNRFPSEADFNTALEQRGMSTSDLRDKLKRRIAIQQLIEAEVPKEFDTTDAERQTFYDEHPEMFTRPERVRASHILIQLKPDADETASKAAREKIEEVRKKLDAGEDFAELAKAHSEGPSGPKGGDLGYFSKGRMVKPFEDAAFALKTGETSEVVQTDFGLHLIRVTDHQPEETVAFEDAKEDIGRMLVDQKRRGALETYINGLRGEAKIEQPNG